MKDEEILVLRQETSYMAETISQLREEIEQWHAENEDLRWQIADLHATEAAQISSLQSDNEVLRALAVEALRRVQQVSSARR